jgi:hypothetical protein
VNQIPLRGLSDRRFHAPPLTEIDRTAKPFRQIELQDTEHQQGHFVSAAKSTSRSMPLSARALTVPASPC